MLFAEILTVQTTMVSSSSPQPMQTVMNVLRPTTTSVAVPTIVPAPQPTIMNPVKSESIVKVIGSPGNQTMAAKHAQQQTLQVQILGLVQVYRNNKSIIYLFNFRRKTNNLPSHGCRPHSNPWPPTCHASNNKICTKCM